jgi:hypothetical protein
MRQMILVGFLQAQNCTNHPSSWRHPASRTDSWSADFYRYIGRVLEEGKFHLGFSTIACRCRTCTGAIMPTPSNTASAA